MRIFLSSVMHNMDDYRNAAAHALTVLGHEVKRAEDYGALPTSPQQACLTGVREADLVVLLLGAEYGYVQPSGFSATHEEYREAKERHDVLAFVQKNVTRDSSQEKFVQEARDWQTGKFTADFRTPDELRDAITSAVHNLELSRTVGPVDEAEMLKRARNYIPAERNDLRDTGMYLIVVGGPKQQVLRPSDIENKDLSERLTDRAISRDVKFFTRSEGTKDQIVNNALILDQEHAAILLDEFGAVRLMHAPSDDRSQSSRMMGALRGFVEEDIRESVRRMLMFAGAILDDIDHLRRLSDVVIILAVFHSGYPGWKTRAEDNQERNSWTGQSRSNPIVIEPSVVSHKRAALLFDADRLAEDFTVLLRREIQGQKQ